MTSEARNQILKLSLQHITNIYKTLASPVLGNASEVLMFRDADERTLLALNMSSKNYRLHAIQS